MPRQTQFRFPGRIEWRYSYALPSIGEVVISAGESWKVASVEEDEDALICTLEPDESCGPGQRTPEELGSSLLAALLGHEPVSLSAKRDVTRLGSMDTCSGPP